MKNLNKLSKEELINLAMKQQEEVAEIKGYASGIRAHHLETFSKEQLIDCYKQTERSIERMKEAKKKGMIIS